MKKAKKEASKQSTEEKAFKPTPHMRFWLETAIRLNTDNITEIAQECDMDRTIWYQWLKQPGFIEWFEIEWGNLLKGAGWRLDIIGLRNAQGDFKFWEAMQKRLGRIKPESVNFQNLQINTTSRHLEEQADKYPGISKRGRNGDDE